MWRGGKRPIGPMRAEGKRRNSPARGVRANGGLVAVVISFHCRPCASPLVACCALLGLVPDMHNRAMWLSARYSSSSSPSRHLRLYLARCSRCGRARRLAGNRWRMRQANQD